MRILESGRIYDAMLDSANKLAAALDKNAAVSFSRVCALVAPARPHCCLIWIRRQSHLRRRGRVSSTLSTSTSTFYHHGSRIRRHDGSSTSARWRSAFAWRCRCTRQVSRRGYDPQPTDSDPIKWRSHSYIISGSPQGENLAN